IAGTVTIPAPVVLGNSGANIPDATPMILIFGGTLKATNSMTIPGSFGMQLKNSTATIDTNGNTVLYQGKVFTNDGTDVLNVASSSGNGTLQFSGAFAAGSSYRS